MFKWFQKAIVCYVALADFPPQGSVANDLPTCRWFSRGWTLQELIAPRNVIFFDTDWRKIGSKRSLAPNLMVITKVSYEALVHGIPSLTSIATRMSWASRRETKRIEDQAYCLLGMFDVSMPLIYGEGTKAFRRLQEEIMKRSNDLTLFAWDIPIGSQSTIINPLAPSPAVFASNRVIDRFVIDCFVEFSLTNSGLRISDDVPLRTVTVTDPIQHRRQTLYVIFLGYSGDFCSGGIYLRKLGPNLFSRDGSLALAGFHSPVVYEPGFFGSGTCILLDQSLALFNARANRDLGIHVSPDNGNAFVLTAAYPATLWDVTDRIFLSPKRHSWSEYPMVLVMRFNVTLNGMSTGLAVLIHHPEGRPVVKIFTQHQYPKEYEVIYQERYKNEGIHVHELHVQAPGIRGTSNMTLIPAREGFHQIHATIPTGTTQIESFVGFVNVFTLTFEVHFINVPHRVQ
ncbi:hypothetical protein BKA63DRAFT_500530 [Paraphoma chrysanthemicola]|nr:hypothetical protein BKA63DRAFT_500530 [Paraphoma chrysanthemicola]